MNRESFAKKKLPERPDLVLRLGFAGNRNLPDDPDNLLPRAINWVLDGISRQLAILAPGVLDPPTPATSPEHVLKFYSQEFPVLRIVTGLAEGADSLIGKEVIRRRNSSGTEFSATRVRQSAILPCQPEAYRESRDLNLYSHSYDELLEDCDHIIVFDGPSTLYPRGNTKEGRQLETPIDKERRGHAYRAQSELILRNSDLLLAVADRSVPGLAGGTLETIRDAQHFKLPVVLIDLITSTNPAFDRQAVNDNTAKIPERLLRQARISLVEPGEPFKGAMLPDECFLVGESSQRASEQAREEKVSIELQRWITAITAGPNLSLPDESHKTPGKHSHLDFLSDFFDREDVPPKKEAWSDFASREALWKNFLIHCGKITRLGDYIRREFRALRDGTHHVFPPPSFRESPGDAIPAGAPERRHLEEIEKFRGRATELNYHFTGLYRGAFILNYGLAVFAVFIAALSLVLIGEEKSLPQVVGDIFSSTADLGASCHVGEHASHAYTGWLAGLAFVKLCVVIGIFYQTRTANRNRWNDRAINSRYLAERLRLMWFLPLSGSFQPPAAGPTQYASRALTQGVFDWLFDAFTRSLDPLKVLNFWAEGKTIRLQPGEARESARHHLLGYRASKATQRGYHWATVRENLPLFEFLERAASLLSIAVILAVFADIGLIYLESVYHSALAKKLAPWAAFFTALAPAAVAALNGIRFQSECQRLADRSTMMGGILDDHLERLVRLENRMNRYQRGEDRAADPMSWNTDVLLAIEDCARDLARESAEWTVLYAKELPEPG